MVHRARRGITLGFGRAPCLCGGGDEQVAADGTGESHRIPVAGRCQAAATELCGLRYVIEAGHMVVGIDVPIHFRQSIVEWGQRGRRREKVDRGARIRRVKVLECIRCRGHRAIRGIQTHQLRAERIDLIVRPWL